MSLARIAAVVCSILLIQSSYAGFTNNSPSPTLVIELGAGEGSFRVNSLTPDGQLRTSANSVIDPSNPDTFSEEFSGAFEANWVAATNFSCGLDFDIMFDSPVIGVIATNAFSLGSVRPLAVDLMRVFSDATGFPTFAGSNPLGLDIGPWNPDSLTVDGNRVFGDVNFPIETFTVLTATSSGNGFGGGGVTAVPEPMTIGIWALLGMFVFWFGYRRSRKQAVGARAA